MAQAKPPALDFLLWRLRDQVDDCRPYGQDRDLADTEAARGWGEIFPCVGEKPKPTDFGLTDSEVESLMKERARKGWMPFRYHSNLVKGLVGLFDPKVAEYRKKQVAYDKYDLLCWCYEHYKRKADEAFWKQLSGRQLEIEMAHLFQRRGCCAELTKASCDKGVDIKLRTVPGAWEAIDAESMKSLRRF